MPPSRPLAQCSAAALRAVVGLFTDIDDTLTRDAAIEPAALDALHRLAAAGLPVVAVTGRPMGWCKPFALQWPVAAIVAENGAVALMRDARGTLQVEYAQDETTRARNARRLAAVAARIQRELPGVALARDSAGRVTDIAIDHGEFARLTPTQVDAVVALMHAEGMVATVSSIHVNGWFGSHDKCSGADWMVQRLFGRRLADELPQWVYVGDSTNDQAMFRRFPLSVGVANLLHFAHQMTDWPAYITRAERGQGFAEVVQTLLRARAAA